MQHLKTEIDRLLATLPDAAEIRSRVQTLGSGYPFNEYEFIISHLLARNVLTLDQYLELRDNYIARNRYLYIFEMGAPRVFGETWGQGHLKELVPEVVEPTAELDLKYSGEYDFLLDGEIRIEVKASRAVDKDSKAALYVKPLTSDSTKPFLMNFQQIKPACCDVFVLIAVWRDVIKYWVLSSREVESNRYYSKGQHRGNVGEGQLHVKQYNMKAFDAFQVPSNKLADAIRSTYKRQIGGTNAG